MADPKHDDDRRDSRPGRQLDPRNARSDEVPEALREHDEHGNVITRPFDFIERTHPEDRPDRAGQLTRDNVNPNIPSAKPGEGRLVEPESTQGGEAPPAREVDPPDELPRLHSINEPPGSNVLPGPGGPNTLPPGTEMPTPVIETLEPDTAVIGSADFTLYVHGTGFVNGVSVIHFAGHDEPTTLNEDGTISTGVKPSLWAEPVDVVVEVRNGTKASTPAMFSFTAAAADDEALPSEAELEKLTRAELDELAEKRGVDITGAGNKHDVIRLLRKDWRKRHRK